MIQHVREQGHDKKQGLDLEYLEVIAEKAECPFTTLVTWVERPERAGPMVFDVADKLLCACHLWGMWYSELRDYYEAVNLRMLKCACPGCSTEFEIGVDAFGRDKHAIYCSPNCSRTAYKLRKGERQQRLPLSRRDLKLYCRHGHKRSTTPQHATRGCGQCLADRKAEKCNRGHKWTEENTMLLKNGRRKCRTCHNQRSLASYHASKEAIAA